MKDLGYDIAFCGGEGCILRDPTTTKPCSLFWKENNPAKYKQ